MLADIVGAGRLERAWRRRRKLTVDEERARFLAEIRDDIADVCPKHQELAQTLRHFAARYLVVEEPHGLVLGVMSAGSGEGRTTVSMGLAGAIADMCSNVLFVELAGEPGLSAELGLPPGSGLRGYFLNQASLEEVVEPTGKANLWLLPAGPAPVSPSRLAGTAATSGLFSKLRERYAVTVIDLPPLLESEEAPALVTQLDGVVLVVAAGSTTTEEVAQTVSLLGPVPLRGVLLNRTSQRAPNWIASLLRES